MDKRGRATDATARPALAIALLGGFRVRVGETAVPDAAWRLAKAKSLLKLLALAPAHRLARDVVLDQLWPELDPEAAANNLHQTLHSVRRALTGQDGAAELRLQHGVLALQPDGPLQVDVDAFEAAAARARGSDDPALYVHATDLYSGDLLPDDLYEDWAVGRREMLRDTYLRLLLGLARRHEARGELKSAMAVLSRTVEAEPAHEEAHVQLMRLYAATGQQARALRQYDRLAGVLAAELDAEPDPASRRLRDAIGARRFAGEEASREDEPHAPRHNLPIPLTSFIGRDRELTQIRECFATSRFLTLTGVGGAGKTRLAVRAGWELLDRYRDGVWLVRLGALADGGLIAASLSSALGLTEQPDHTWLATLVENIRTRRLLLILDNCEHLREGCAQLIRDVLTACAEVDILATSRSRIGVPGEAVMVVQPLSIPATDDVALEELQSCEAIRLFLERARFRQPSFALTPRNAAGVARVCRRMEGIPLAIELAAARVGVLTVQQMAERLDDTLALLTSGDSEETRHQTLRATLDWSFDLLDDGERSLFRRLAVFEGGWFVEAAEALQGDLPSVLDVLAGLVDKSLVVVEGATEDAVRYRLLTPVRQYARERLRDAGEEATIRARHAEYFLAVAETAEGELRGTQARQWLDRLEADHANLRAALRWAQEQGQLDAGLRIAASIWRFWFARGYLQEGRATLSTLLDAAQDDPSVPAAVRAKAYNAAGAIAFYQTDAGEAIARYEAALALFRALADDAKIARVLSNLALVFKDRGERKRAARLFEEALDIQTRLGDADGMANTLGNLGILAQEDGEYDQAWALHQRSLGLKRRLGVSANVIATLNNLGAVAVEQGRLEEAQALLRESLDLARELGIRRSQIVAANYLGKVARLQGRLRESAELHGETLRLARDHGEPMTIASALEGLAATCAVSGQSETAVTLFAAAAALRQSAGIPLPPAARDEYDRIIAGARKRLGVVFDDAWAAGQNEPTERILPSG